MTDREFWIINEESINANENSTVLGPEAVGFLVRFFIGKRCLMPDFQSDFPV